MDKEFKETNKKYFWYPIATLIVGILLGVSFPSPKPSKTKEYPIEVQCYWSTNGYSSYPTQVCDSIKGDTLWKDGGRIVTKNIINVSFK
jgi:hypothetical protein